LKSLRGFPTKSLKL